MQLSRIDIELLPGIDPIQVTDLRPGTNFITGPNAIGKSSLIRALHYLLADARPGDPSALSISARFNDGQHHWQAQRNGQHRRWLRDDEPGDPPSLPTPDTLHCYWLRAETLISPDGDSDPALERRLREALAGGIDLDRVREDAGLIPAAFPRNERSEWQAAIRHREDTERHYRDLEEQRARRPNLARQQADARAARDSLERLNQCYRLKEAMDQRRALEARQAEFPAVLRALEGNEAEQIDALDQRIDTLRQELRDLARTRVGQDTTLAATGLAERQPDRGLISDCRQRLEALRSAEQTRAHAAEAQAVAATERDHAAAALNVDTATAPALDPATVDSVGEALREYRAAREMEARTRTPARSTDRITLACLALATASGLGAGIADGLTGQLLTATGALVAGLAAAAAAVRLRLSQRTTSAGFEVVTAEARDQLDTTLGRAGLAHLDYVELGLARFLDLVSALDRARLEHDREAARVAERDRQIATTQARLRERLAAWIDVGETADTPALQTALESLDERLDRARDCLRAIDESRREEDRLQADLDDCRNRKASIYAKAALSSDDRSGLNERLADQHRYMDNERALEQARVVEKQLEAPLANHPDLVEWCTRAEPGTIATAIEEKQETAERLEPLTRELADLDAELERAGSDDTLAGAMASEQALARSLSDRYDGYLQASLGDWLLTDIEADYRKRHEPGLLRDARERFEQFTHHQWSFEVDAAHRPVARDLSRDVRRPLTALSSGTRMQLLLAARIAWARDQEGHGSPLPLVLDEALTNTDADRFAAIARNLETLTQDEGRQILYLTARHEDLDLWQQSVGEAPHCIDLGVLRGVTDRAPRLSAASPSRQPPAPGDCDAVEYGELLQVPAIDPLEEAGMIHLFHLLRDDLEGLYTLMSQWRLSRLGPFAAWLETPAGGVGRQPLASGDSLGERLLIARAWHELAREGRDHPVDRAVIETAGSFSAKMGERVAEQADRLAGDPAALLDTLRGGTVRRLQQDHINAFESWLQENDYLDPRPRLDADTLTRRLLDQLGHRADPVLIQRISQWLAAGTDDL
ncbi:AAA family ATPase [Spiribacter vilamensis]|uniref:Uncharacterized protein YhaN n=1 Tax=Spiribacter vilamensis TaxID=531306 RepID=A0A4Q8CYR1_9GAMM|nr:AAA family ATPase [Spiribacter vilamensis]RZU98128.1 uncharacterized protein YhaN [Spiribacter vilamensis]TVO60971.1 hypothetical protein FPL09_02110 [Spiribacter vilamensis]